MNSKKLPVLSSVLYILAALLCIFSIWTFIQIVGDISDLILYENLTFTDNEYGIINYFMTGCVEYLVLAAILFALGFMYQKNDAFYKAHDFVKKDVVKKEGEEKKEKEKE